MASAKRCSRSRHRRATTPRAGCGSGPCEAVVERLRRLGLPGSRSDSAVGGLDDELALLLGIELADGGVL